MATTADDIIHNKNSTQTIKQLSRNLFDGKEPSNQQVLGFFNKAASIMQSLPDYDVIGMEALVERLRLELRQIHDRQDGINSINKLSAKIK
ncbi:MAG: hypothetical protein OEX11_09290, partial [Nitrosomonas sp.]|nr:hypothetical protein [Nitrosomonas sp.]